MVGEPLDGGGVEQRGVVADGYGQLVVGQYDGRQWVVTPAGLTLAAFALPLESRSQ